MRRSAFKRAVAVVLMVTTPGCITQAVWKPACESVAVEPQIAGVVRNYPWPGARSLIVRYRAIGDGTDVDLVVPIKPDGRAVEPFLATVSATTQPTADADSTTKPARAFTAIGLAVNSALEFEYRQTPEAARRQAAMSRALGLTSRRLADVLATALTITPDRPRLAPHLCSADFTPIPTASLPARGESPSDATDTVHLLAYRFDGHGDLQNIPNDRLPGDLRYTPVGDHLILVPTAVPRPPGDQGRNQIVAGVLTPVAVGGDIGATGLLIGAGGAALGIVLVVAVVALPIAAVAAVASAVGNHDGPTSAPSK